MRPWTQQVDQPFRGDARFWTSVAASIAGLPTFVGAVTLHVVVGAVAAVSYVVPLTLLAVAAVTGRASSAATRPLFASDVDWQDAERRAVAAALVPGLGRMRGRSVPS